MLCLALTAVLTAAATDRFYIEDFSVKTGDTVEVNILLDNEAEYTAFQSDFYLPEGLTLPSTSNFGMSLTDRKARSHTFSATRLPNGGIRLLSYSTSLGTYKGNSGALVTFMVIVGADLAGPTTIELKNTFFTTPAGVEVAFPDETCTVTTAATVLLGDVNGDGSVNISDVTALIDYLLSGNASGINLSGADCNQDGSVNIADVTALIDYLLSGTWN